MFRICGNVKAVCFPIQKVYKIIHSDEDTTSEPLNPEPLNPEPLNLEP
jgi:hypothetical protein